MVALSAELELGNTSSGVLISSGPIYTSSGVPATEEDDPLKPIVETEQGTTEPVGLTFCARAVASIITAIITHAICRGSDVQDAADAMRRIRAIARQARVAVIAVEQGGEICVE